MKPRVKFATNLEFPFDHSKAMSTHFYQTKQSNVSYINNSNNRKKSYDMPRQCFWKVTISQHFNVGARMLNMHMLHV